MITQKEGTAKNGLYLTNGSSENTTTSVNLNHGHGISKDGALMGYNMNPSVHVGNGAGPAFQNQNECHLSIEPALGDHSHNIYLGSNDGETRPLNLTIKVWKRIN